MVYLPNSCFYFLNHRYHHRQPVSYLLCLNYFRMRISALLSGTKNVLEQNVFRALGAFCVLTQIINPLLAMKETNRTQEWYQQH